MNYADIIAALPKDVADALHAELDKQQFSPTMSQDEVEELINDSVQVVKLKNLVADDEKRRMVDGLLTMFASAAAKALFA